MLFSTRGIKLPFNDLTTLKSAKWLSEHDNLIIKHYGTILKALTEAINALEKEIKNILPEKAQRLLPENGGLKGIGIISAAIIYVETKGKVVSESALASYAGIAPVENSSGKHKKYHNNKAGNRKLNCVFYKLSIHQSIHDPKGKLYFEKKQSEGKSKRHARKCLSRQLVKQVCKLLSD